MKTKSWHILTGNSYLCVLRGIVIVLAIPAFVSYARAQSVTVINFDSIDASSGSTINATSYLATYGITATSPNGGFLDIVSDQAFYGTPGIVYASSGHNFVQPVPTIGTNPVVILTFATPLTSLSFTRIEETGNPSGNSFGQWSAEVFSGVTQIGSTGSVSGYSIFAPSINAAQIYTFTGTDITSLELDGDNQGFYGTSGILLDNLTLTSAIPEPSTYAVLFGLAALGFAAYRRRKK